MNKNEIINSVNKHEWRPNMQLDKNSTLQEVEHEINTLMSTLKYPYNTPKWNWKSH